MAEAPAGEPTPCLLATPLLLQTQAYQHTFAEQVLLESHSFTRCNKAEALEKVRGGGRAAHGSRPHVAFCLPGSEALRASRRASPSPSLPSSAHPDPCEAHRASRLACLTLPPLHRPPRPLQLAFARGCTDAWAFQRCPLLVAVSLVLDTALAACPEATISQVTLRCPGYLASWAARWLPGGSDGGAPARLRLLVLQGYRPGGVLRATTCYNLGLPAICSSPATSTIYVPHWS